MEPNQKFPKDEGLVLTDAKQYKRLIVKLQYLTITRPYISYDVSKLAQYSSDPRNPHLKAFIRSLDT